jgi:lysophospholipase L1-like esterase
MMKLDASMRPRALSTQTAHSKPKVLTKPAAMVEAVWAKYHIHLADEPEGERFGVVNESESKNEDGSLTSAMTLVAVGDSMVAACGTSDQREGMIPDIAEGLSRYANRPVQWETYGGLGATMRRVRYRLMPQVTSHPDILIVCAGSNDIMAQRGIEEWEDDLRSTLAMAVTMSEHVVVLSPGQMQHEPSLGKALRRILEAQMDNQAAVSERVCAQFGVTYVNMVHEDVHVEMDGFYASDHFHPSVIGYRNIADGVVRKLGRQFVEGVAR